MPKDIPIPSKIFSHQRKSSKPLPKPKHISTPRPNHLFSSIFNYLTPQELILSLLLITNHLAFFLQSMSTDLIKQIKIKTSVLKRLRKEYESYEKEAKSIQDKLAHYQHQLQAVEKDEEMETAIRKNKEFLVESQTVQTNVKQKLVESFEALALFISEKGNDENVASSQEKSQAESLLLEIQTYLETLE